MKKKLFKLEEILSKLKKFYDNDDTKYTEIRNVEKKGQMMKIITNQ